MLPEQRWGRNRQAPALGGSMGNSSPTNRRCLSTQHTPVVWGPGTEGTAEDEVPAPCPWHVAFEWRRQPASGQTRTGSRGADHGMAKERWRI